jgi:hypothetical protein
MGALPAVVDERLPVRKRRRESLSMKEIGPEKCRKSIVNFRATAHRSMTP